MALDHSCQSDYVWQLDLRREANHVTANFREVRLPRTVDVAYPRNAFALADDWTKKDVTFISVRENVPVGYACIKVDSVSAMAWVTDLVVSPEQRRKGAASALLMAAQAWALERGVNRILLEMASKNQPCIRLAQKFGYEFCGYNDRYYSTQDVTLFFARAIK
jgi:GNAT superfamily N-acetyltransferase